MHEFNNTPKDPNTDPDPDPDSSSSLNSVESEILNMLKENEISIKIIKRILNICLIVFLVILFDP